MYDKTFKVDRDMLIYGMRYALGRQTFAPSTVVENIKHNIDLVSVHDMGIMIRDIEQHGDLDEKAYGMECDKQTWMSFKKYLENEIDKRDIGIVKK